MIRHILSWYCRDAERVVLDGKINHGNSDNRPRTNSRSFMSSKVHLDTFSPNWEDKLFRHRAEHLMKRVKERPGEQDP
jgi:hypothetical protein